MGISKLSHAIFLKDTDKYWYRFDSRDSALMWLEKIDVENNEYQCWDGRGNYISISLDRNGNICFEETHAPSKQLISEMIESIPMNAKINIYDNLDIEKLWKIIYSLQKSNSGNIISKAIGKLFKNIYRK